MAMTMTMRMIMMIMMMIIIIMIVMIMKIRMRMRLTIWKKCINNWLDKIIDQTKSFEDQIKLLKKVIDLEPWFMNDYGDKELKFKIFKLKL